MKKSFFLSIFSFCLFCGSIPTKAEWDYWGMTLHEASNDWTVDVYTVNDSTGERTYRTSFKPLDKDYTPAFTSVDGDTITFYEGDDPKNLRQYDLTTDTWTDLGEPTRDTYMDYVKRSVVYIDPDGAVHVGPNSAIFKEENGREKFWAQDANGKAIPIDITNGSKLLINGRDVEQSINNVGALSAALTGLPTVPTDTTLACGLGTGTHGGDFAFSGGCASKVNEKLSINYAASMTMPGQEYAGDFVDQFSARAGFVWQLGKSNKPTQISINQKKEMDLKISKLENNNELLKSDIELFKAENKELKTKNNEIISQNEKLLSRLEKLENIAFKFQEQEKYKLSKSISK